MLEKNLPMFLWVYTVKASIYIRNRYFNPRTGKTAIEMYTGVKPSIAKMEVFCLYTGQEIVDDRCRGREDIFVGFHIFSPAYLM